MLVARHGGEETEPREIAFPPLDTNRAIIIVANNLTLCIVNYE